MAGMHLHAVAFGVDEYADFSDIVVDEGLVEDPPAALGRRKPPVV